MDAVNERRIHSLVVDTATSSASSQYHLYVLLIKHTPRYFLITPKLLTNLEYHPNMHIMCVFNGTHIPPSSELRTHCCWSGDRKRRRLVGNLEVDLLESNNAIDDERSGERSDELSDEDSMTYTMQDIEISTT